MSDARVRTQYLTEDNIDYSFMRGLMKKCIEVGCASNAEGEMDEWFVEAGSLDRRYADITLAVQSLINQECGTIEVWYKGIPVSIQVNLSSDLVPDVPHIALSVSHLYFEDWNERSDRKSGNENIDNFINLCVYIYKYSDPLYAYGITSVSAGDRRHYRPSIDRVLEGIVENPFWINLFPPQMVEYLGRDTLLTAPAYNVTELGRGSILLVATEVPYSFGPLNDQSQQVVEHIGLDFPNEGCW